jgi:hypothetical protein
MEITSNRVSKLLGRAIEKRCTGHARLHQAEKSEMGENSIEADERMLTRLTGYMGCLVKEVFEIRLRPDNFSRDTGFPLSR